MDERAVKMLVADLMEALDAAGEGHPDNEAYAAARRWMETGHADPVHNVRVRVSREHLYRIRSNDAIAAIQAAEELAASDYGYDPNDQCVEGDTADEDAPEFEDLDVHTI